MSENIPITSWAEDDRPREKLMLKGKHALSDAELIAILLLKKLAKNVVYLFAPKWFKW